MLGLQRWSAAASKNSQDLPDLLDLEDYVAGMDRIPHTLPTPCSPPPAPRSFSLLTVTTQEILDPKPAK